MNAAAPKRFGRTAIMTSANAVTLGRVVFGIPVLIFIAVTGSHWATVACWFVISVTDWLDGYLARKEGTTSSGAFLDPLADKVLVLGGFLAVAARGSLSYWFVLALAAREAFVSLYRFFAARQGISMPARPLGKIKTFVQFATVGWILLPPTADAKGWHTIWATAAIAITWISGVDLIANSVRRRTNEDQDPQPLTP